MKVTGSATLNASRDEVWKALNDPAVLVRTIPAVTRLEETGPDAYRMTITAGVASIKGVYTGDVSLSEQKPGDSFVLKAAGAGCSRHGQRRRGRKAHRGRPRHHEPDV